MFRNLLLNARYHFNCWLRAIALPTETNGLSSSTEARFRIVSAGSAYETRKTVSNVHNRKMSIQQCLTVVLPKAHTALGVEPKSRSFYTIIQSNDVNKIFDMPHARSMLVIIRVSCPDIYSIYSRSPYTLRIWKAAVGRNVFYIRDISDH